MFKAWMEELADKHGKDVVLPGMEPTGRYWFALGKFLQDNGMRHPHHVKKSKELDDSSPSKNDRKDPKMIAALVNEGRFSYPYISTGIYAEIRSLSNLRFQTQEEIPYTDKLMEIKGIGLVTVSGFIAEVGDIGRFDSPKQLQKLAGYAIMANDSGKHNDESRISYRGRKRLRYTLYEAAISLIGKNAEFKEIHEYYRTRKDNPLKKMQSVVAIACKVIRVFYAILTKGVDFAPQKLMSDVHRPQMQAA